VQKLHNWWVYPPGKDKPPFMIPLGEHGKRSNPPTQRGHIKKMARQFGISDCMLEALPGL
jgi:hypothetical protein